MKSKCNEISAFEALKKHPVSSVSLIIGWVGLLMLTAIEGNPFETGYTGLVFFSIGLFANYYLVVNQRLIK